MNKEKTSKEIIKELMNTDFTFKTETGEVVEIPPKGNLGLLASGYKGVIAVRQTRKSIVEEKKSNKKKKVKK